MAPQNDAAAAAATRIEDTYRNTGAAAAADALRRDYESALDGPSQAILKAETARIQHDNPGILPHLALEWAKPEVEGDRLTQARLSDMAMFGNAITPTNKGQADMSFAGDMAAQLNAHYNDFTRGNWGTGINRSDIDRWEGRYDNTRQDAAIANALLSRDAGGTSLITKIAGVNGMTADNGQDTLQGALDRDKKHQFMTPDQRAQVQYLHDHWTDSAIAQLSQDHQGRLMNEDSLSAFAQANNVHPTDASAQAAPAAAPTDHPGAAAADHPGAAPADHPGAAPADHPGAAPADHPAPGPTAFTPPASLHAEHGAGYWDIAAQELGLESSDTSKSLAQRRHEMNAHPMTAEQHRQLVALMRQLEHAGHGPLNGQGFNFTNNNGTVSFDTGEHAS